MRRAQRRTAVWKGRGATARAREAKWSSGVAAVFWVYYNKNVFEDPFGHYYYYYYYCYYYYYYHYYYYYCCCYYYYYYYYHYYHYYYYYYCLLYTSPSPRD